MIIPRQGSINNFDNPDLLPALKPGETAKFELLNIKKDPDNPSQNLLPYAMFIRPKQRVKDPTSKDGKWTVLANITEEHIDGTFNVSHIVFHHSEGGIKILHGDDPAEADQYTFLMLCNDNQSNELRDPKSQPKFKQLVESEISKSRRSERAIRKEAMDIAYKMKEKEVKEFCASMNWDQNDDMGILRDKVETMAETTPDEFLNRLKDGNREMKAAIKTAFDENIIFFDVQKKRFAFTADKSTIFSSTSRIEPQDYVDRLADFFISDAKSRNTYDLMVNRTKGKKELESEESAHAKEESKGKEISKGSVDKESGRGSIEL